MGSLPVEIFNPLNPDSFSDESQVVVDFLAEYYKDVKNYPVQSQVKPGYLKKFCSDIAPYSLESLESILEDVRDHIIPGLTHWQSPNFFGYFQANVKHCGFSTKDALHWP
ncbi:hypothetical protein GIB67_025218 [Kingdonia uniflora]|uniref:tyrosine decarboxylase n=1 Tax=Kingdonia uniflora TaxID=39325 RepID=A0A7J7N8J9_9MAGN|nr:hypothetical protein GIB67_025218 [Kingdonia uniflora]